ncbi:hypothetical protein B1A85_16770 [Chroococcidiopsis sp. TS-821]|nr:hypothetical protein B1A85_16770 [Chroococcidiopsis sp. TS-821]
MTTLKLLLPIIDSRIQGEKLEEGRRLPPQNANLIKEQLLWLLVKSLKELARSHALFERLFNLKTNAMLYLILKHSTPNGKLQFPK